MTFTAGASPLPLALPGVANPETAISRRESRLPVGTMRGRITLLPKDISALILLLIQQLTNF